MKIEIWSDYACPFCYIGEKRLARALAEVGDKNISATKFQGGILTCRRRPNVLR